MRVPGPDSGRVDLKADPDEEEAGEWQEDIVEVIN